MLLLLLAAPGALGLAEVMRLQGPRNTSVQKGGVARLKCRLLVMKDEKLGFGPWRIAPNQRITAQWNIDGFGYTLETLLDTFSGRYTMPGPINEGLSY